MRPLLLDYKGFDSGPSFVVSRRYLIWMKLQITSRMHVALDTGGISKVLELKDRVMNGIKKWSRSSLNSL